MISYTANAQLLMKAIYDSSKNVKDFKIIENNLAPQENFIKTGLFSKGKSFAKVVNNSPDVDTHWLEIADSVLNTRLPYSFSFKNPKTKKEIYALLFCPKENMLSVRFTEKW